MENVHVQSISELVESLIQPGKNFGLAEEDSFMFIAKPNLEIEK